MDNTKRRPKKPKKIRIVELKEIPRAINRKENEENQSPGHVDPCVINSLLRLIETIPSPQMTTNFDSPQATISSSNENVRKLNLSSLSLSCVCLNISLLSYFCCLNKISTNCIKKKKIGEGACWALPQHLYKKNRF